MYFFIVTIILFVLIIIYLILKLKNCHLDKTPIIKTLLRQSARWSTAASQDANHMIAILHANYGAGYLWALKDIATDNEIEKTGVDILKFRDEIVKVQDEATIKMANACKNFAPKKTYLTEISKQN